MTRGLSRAAARIALDLQTAQLRVYAERWLSQDPVPRRGSKNLRRPPRGQPYVTSALHAQPRERSVKCSKSSTRYGCADEKQARHIVAACGARHLLGRFWSILGMVVRACDKNLTNADVPTCHRFRVAFGRPASVITWRSPCACHYRRTWR